jgi:tetratricopeptide (TPR) repeat protein
LRQFLFFLAIILGIGGKVSFASSDIILSSEAPLLPVESIAVMGDVGHTQLVVRLPQKTFYEISIDDTHKQLTLRLDGIDPGSSILPVDLNNTAIQNIQYNITEAHQLDLVLSVAPTVNVQGLRMTGNGPVELVLDLGIGNIPYIQPRAAQTAGPVTPVLKTPDPLSPEELAQKDYTEAVNLLTQNNTESAVLLLQTLLQQHPAFEAARVTLAEIYLSQNQPRKSLNILKAVNFSDVSAHTDYFTALAEAYRQTGSAADAASIYQTLLNIDVHNATWWAGLGMSFQALHHPKAAHTAFVKADSLGSLSLPLQQYVSTQLTQDS